MDYLRLRKALRRERIAAGLTLDALAQRARLNRATVHGIESVEREPNLKPRFDTVDRLVAALGLPLAVFLDRLEREEAEPVTHRHAIANNVLMGDAAHSCSGTSDADRQAALVAAIGHLVTTVDRLLRATASDGVRGSTAVRKHTRAQGHETQTRRK